MKKKQIKKRMDIYYPVVSTRVSQHTENMLKDLAVKEGRTISYIVNRIIKKYLEK